MFLGVPRVWEKIQDKMELQLKEMKGFKRALCKWAQVRGKICSKNKPFRRKVGWKFILGWVHESVGKRIMDSF